MNTLVDKVALAIWRAREMDFPERTRRLTPDDMDYLSGAWEFVRRDAKAAIEAMNAHAANKEPV